jgi:hypothetical protein
MFKLQFTPIAKSQLEQLQKDNSLKKRLKALAYLETNPRHPGLNTHKYSAIADPRGEEVFEAYAENNTPVAYRLFWCYGPVKNTITIIAITPHP